ncbi:OmpA family protein [Magnetospirillum sp. UT-4]|uniref:OmpA family protein n=1 Tax=Magnetospirillum sp. UT-4 TaxID=2681467 RepID=UPI001572D830|nr:OmpA family protein [Magnetospirillum sp. UT-4]
MAKALALAATLSACSSVPDAINPIEWYKGASDMVTGRERPEVASPVPVKTADRPDVNTVPARTATARAELPKALVADRGGQYAEPVRREVTPTRPLARRTPAAADTQMAAAAPGPGATQPVTVPQAAVPPKPAVQAAELPPAGSPAPGAQAPRTSAPGQAQPAARTAGLPESPAQLSMTPPPRADIPETVPMPNRAGRPKQLQAQYERRLAESGQQTLSAAGMVDMPQPVAAARGYDDAPIHLVPPTTARQRGGGGKGMAAPLPVQSGPAASFQVAALDFNGGTARLTRADMDSIAEVARLYRQTGGVIRVLGHAPTPSFSNDAVTQLMGGLDASMDRANAVARELNKRGVPAAKIMVGADPSVAAMGGAGAQVFLDVM